MGIFDSYLADINNLKKDLGRASDGLVDGLGKIDDVSQKVVEAIDKIEEKVNNIPSEAEIKEKLKQKISSDQEPAEK